MKSLKNAEVVEFGRHAILRGWWVNCPCGFKSRLRHHESDFLKIF